MADWFFQYQVKAEPILDVFSETVMESKFHQPFSEPVRHKIIPGLMVALIAASGAVTPQSNIGGNEASFHQPWSEPIVKAKPGLAVANQPYCTIDPLALTTPETVMESKFHQPWSEPPHYLRRKWLLAGANIELARYPGTNIPEENKLDKWYRWLNEPVRFRTFHVSLQLAFSIDQFSPPIPHGGTSRMYGPVPWQGYRLPDPQPAKKPVRITPYGGTVEQEAPPQPVLPPDLPPIPTPASPRPPGFEALIPPAGHLDRVRQAIVRAQAGIKPPQASPPPMAVPPPPALQPPKPKRVVRLEVTRDPKTGRINGIKPVYG